MTKPYIESLGGGLIMGRLSEMVQGKVLGGELELCLGSRWRWRLASGEKKKLVSSPSLARTRPGWLAMWQVALLGSDESSWAHLSEPCIWPKFIFLFCLLPKFFFITPIFLLTIPFSVLS